MKFGRDALGRVNSQSLADGNVWRFGRDEAGNILTVTEPDGTTVHSFTYTPEGLLDSYTSPMNAVESFKYDRDKLLTRRQYPSGNAVAYDYNVKGQLTQVRTPEGNHSFGYNATTGLLTQALSRDGQQQDFTYDGSLLKSAVWTGVVSDTVAYTYNNDLQISQLNYGGTVLPLTYDNDGLLTGVGTITLSRDSGNGLLTDITDGVFSISNTRNTYGEVQTVTASHNAAALYNTSITYDALGRIFKKVETMAGVTHTWTYAYDSVGQLLQVSRDDVTVESYGYDSVGNRVFISNTLTGVNLGNSDFTYDADNRLLSAGTTSCSYDADGRLHQVQEAAGTTTYHYNTDGTLAQVDLPDGHRITYLHDHRGRRIARAADGIRTHAWLYGEGLMPLAEYDGSGVLQKTFIYAAGPVPVAYIQGGNTFHIVADHLGSPRLVVDSTGAVVKQVDYDSFGNVIADSNPALYLCFGFAGGMADPDHELIRFGARDYQPSTGRWTAKDPIFFRGGYNLYGYVGNDPIGINDSEGTCGVAIIAVAAIGVLIIAVSVAPFISGIQQRTKATNAVIDAVKNKDHASLQQGLDCYEDANKNIQRGSNAFKQSGNFTPDPESFFANLAASLFSSF
jgi:RHS repeat-associated protein